MTEAEAEGAAALHAAAFAGRERGWSAAEFRDLAAAPGAVALLEPAGVLIGRVTAGEAELLTIAVHPDAQRRGLARRLLTAFARHASERGAHEAFLEVAEDNAAARAAYEADGWKVIGRRRGYYARRGGAAIDAIVMRRSLKLDTDDAPSAKKPANRN